MFRAAPAQHPKTVLPRSAGVGRCAEGGDMNAIPSPIRYQLDKAGLRVGQIGPALGSIPPDRLDRLLTESARTGKTLAVLLVEHWSRA
jgi:hypothetical protein